MLPFVCGIPAEWCVFVKAKIQDCPRLVCVTFETKTLGHYWEENGSDVPGYKNISDPFK